MIDSAILTIIPPIVASIFAYVIANKRAKMQYADTIANIQYKAIEVVAAAEQKMREEIRADLTKVREENDKLKQEIAHFHQKIETSDELITSLKAEIIALKTLVDTYREQLISLKRDT